MTTKLSLSHKKFAGNYIDERVSGWFYSKSNQSSTITSTTLSISESLETRINPLIIAVAAMKTSAS